MPSFARQIHLVILVAAVLSLAGCAARRQMRAAVLRCIDAAETDRRACFQGCQGEFEQAFVDCYGHGDCTDGCQSRQLACQAAPLHDLAFCGEAAENPDSCRARLGTDLRACASRPDRVACEDAARRRAAGCWRACWRTQGPALESCAKSLRTCLDGCVPR